MPSWKRKRQDREKYKLRDPNVIPARQRKAGPMDPRNKPRGGARNWRREILEDAMNDSYEPDND